MPKNDQENHDQSLYGLSDSEVAAITNAVEAGDQIHASDLLCHLHSADIADLIENSTLENKRQILALLQDCFNPEILIELASSIRGVVIDLIGAEKAAELIAQVDASDALYVLEDLPEAKQHEILQFIPKHLQAPIIEGLSYPENSAGRIMQKKMVSVPGYWTVKQTLEHLRANPNLPDDFYEVFAVDPKHHPIGGVLVSKLLRSNPTSLITEIMSVDIKIVGTTLDQEETSYLFKKYMLSSVPVVNKDGRLVGVIDINDILEIIEEEAEEDIMHMGGVTETDFHSDFFQTAKLRLPWLLVNFFTACLTSMVINIFQSTIQNLIALAALMPIVASMGGNAGTQTATVAVRAIANKQINHLNYKRVITKQVMISTFNGLILAGLGAITLIFWYHDFYLSFVFAIAVLCNFTLAGLFGSVIPIFLNKIGVDPAISSSIFLTALTDGIGFFIFLALAQMLLV